MRGKYCYLAYLPRLMLNYARDDILGIVPHRFLLWRSRRHGLRLRYYRLFRAGQCHFFLKGETLLNWWKSLYIWEKMRCAWIALEKSYKFSISFVEPSSGRILLDTHDLTSSGNSESNYHNIPRINRDMHHHIFPKCIAALFAFQGRDVYGFMGQLSYTVT